MKHLLWILMVVAAFSLTACGKVGDNPGSDNADSNAMVQEIESQETEDASQSIETSSETSDSQTDPQKSAKNSIFYTNSDFSLQFPKSWKGHYMVMETEEFGIPWRGFFEKGCYEEIDAGWLFSIAGYRDDSYTEQPSYDIIGEWDGITYVIIYPTDVQFYEASKKSQRRYNKMAGQIDDIIETFQVVNRD